MGSLLDLATNVLANIVFWLLLGVTFWWVSRPIQRRFIRFFGLRGPGEMVVYLSNTWNADVSVRTVGFAATKHELLATQTVGHLLSTTPARLPELVEREFGTDCFAICLGFTKPQEYPDQYSEPVVLIRLRT